MTKEDLLMLFAVLIVGLLTVGYGVKGLVVGGVISIMMLALDVIINGKDCR